MKQLSPKKKAISILTVLCVIIVIALWSGIIGDTVWAVINEKIRCSNYDTQAEAQHDFLRDSKKYARLDRNKNGLACESLR